MKSPSHQIILRNIFLSETTFHLWTQIQNMSNHGWEIISHGTYHNDSRTLSESELRDWFNNSKYDIYGNISKMPTTFIYPWGFQNSSINEICLEYYDYCVFERNGENGTWNYEDNIEPLNLRRIIIGNTAMSTMDGLNQNLLNSTILEFDFNENQGTVAYDKSSLINNGVISGCEWQTDGIENDLTQDIDYLYNESNFTLTVINEDLSYAQIHFSYSDRWYDDFGFHVSIVKLIAGFVALGLLCFVVLIVLQNFPKVKD